MRARGSEPGREEPAVTIDFEGKPIPARAGESLAAALIAAGIGEFRRTREGEPRGLFCGMGVCQECLVDIEGQPAQRACMLKITGPLAVRRHLTPARISAAVPIERRQSPFPPDPDVLIVGGGAAGLTAAAAAAETGASTVLIDERPIPGGQFHKQPHAGLPASAAADDAQFAEGRALIARVEASGAAIVEGMVANAYLPLAVTALWQGQAVTLRPRRLIVATGAYERPRAVPGWTLPGVMTTGAAQTLLRSYRVLPGRRLVIAGNGPLNLQVAVELMRAGAEIAAVAERAPRPGLARAGAVAAMAGAAPKLVLQGLNYLRELRKAGVPVHFGTVLEAVGPGLVAVLAPAGPGAASAIEVAADAVCMGYGFLPANELLRLVGCAHDYDPRRGHLVTVRDADFRTSVAGVFGTGDCCGLGGARIAMAEGAIAGIVAAAEASGRPVAREGRREMAAARRALRRHRFFQAGLWTLFAAARPLESAAPDVELCRCEHITLAEVEAVIARGAGGIGSIKRLTRLGMGRCQGRYCVPEAVDRLCRARAVTPCEADFAAPRPPVKPIPISVFNA